ncbi:diaminopimelate epimerase [Salinibacillus kushneri]|uniref:Diaminopimelate epimerase n=1 Tax=Salinibacillus kushneri TaxID=237682 RepID=A0A1H9Y988_9BACI|nr:diaminopimelate epimerase [Salinibacillus kushneri]SES64958.1 diaminopimelate epimerase [Salinibacillus kushneri]
MKIEFTKMHGLGNNYIYIDMFQETLSEKDIPMIARDVSDIHTGVGSDGLILITPSENAEIGMRIFNKDGSEGKTCGNGLRCVAKYVYEKQFVHTTHFTIETKAGIVEAYVELSDGEVNSITVDMGIPVLNRSNIPMIGAEQEKVISEPFELGAESLSLTAVSMGNPHAVFFVDDIQKSPLYELGSIISTDNRFPEGVNCEFIEVINPNEINFRVWERGSGVTQACGSGACASVVASILNGYSRKDEEICVHLTGGDLWIKWASDGHVWMRGPAETIANGEYYWSQH